MQRALNKLFGSSNDRFIKRLVPLVERINALEPDHQNLSDPQLVARTAEFRQRLENGEALDDLLPEAFATVREASKRTLGQRHYDVQMVGGIVLHSGDISEMKTGEGKTLVSTLPSYLNGLTGEGVHVVTVNDYLAQRDAEWMGRVHRFLGLSVGVIVHGLSDAERQASYGSDITYATNNELGFDYLRDNMKLDARNCVQGNLNYAIVDEVDSILVDEARTPLIISGPSEQNTQLYDVANRVIPRLRKGEKGDPKEGIEESGDYWIDEKAGSSTLTEEGIHKVEKTLGVDNLYDPEMLPVIHAVNQALHAHALKRRDVDYVVKPGETGRKEVMIVDEHTGRLMPGRRWSDGLHQAVEAKEGIQVQSENQTLASITFQNYFRMYNKLSGMTGTADTEAPEFAKIYGLEVRLIPTNRPMIRDDMADVVFKTKKEKFNAVVEEIKERHETGQPLLVGTISIESSEMLAKKLKRQGVPHNVLNAKQHEREAEIVAQAGRKGAVMISTNMAGRGTDIVLGGNPEMMALHKCGHDKEHPDYDQQLAHFEAQCAAEALEVKAAGGLHILGTERHESRRIDNQLRGRSGRQGDSGSSQFFLSLEDDLLRIFEADRVAQWWDRVGVEEGEAIENRLLTRVIEGAQKKVEARNFEMRKSLLDYDDVMNKQRQAFYARRQRALAVDSLGEEVDEIVEHVVVTLLDEHWPEKGDFEDKEATEFATALEHQFGVPFSTDAAPFREGADEGLEKNRDPLGHGVKEHLNSVLATKRELCAKMVEEHSEIGYPPFEWFERDLLLRILDVQWKDHLHSMDGLREGIGLRGYAQRDPKLEYQREGFAFFAEMEHRVDEQFAESLFKFVLPQPRVAPVAAPDPPPNAPNAPKADGGGGGGGASQKSGPQTRRERKERSGKVGRNDPCTCGSGKKYKKCCGA